MQSSVDRVLVVGGGIAGLSGAIALRRAGVRVVDILEINPAWSVYGVGIVQQSNALWALHELGLAERVLAAGWPVLGRRVHDREGRVIEEVDAPNLISSGLPPACGVGRLELHKILQDAVRKAGANVRLGVTVAGFTLSDDAVDVTLTDGSQTSYDLVVGADGIRSTVRRMLLGDAYEPRYTGQVCWRANMPRVEGVDRTWSFTGGHGKPGFVPISRDTMYLYFLENAALEHTKVPDEKLPAVFREHLSSYGGVLAEVRERWITDPASIVHRPVEEVVVPAPWHRGRIVLIGDAVHATSPDLGQGSAMAYEDVIVLVECLADQSRSVEERLARFSERRYPRVRLMCQLSREAQEITIAGRPREDLLRVLREANENMAVRP